MNSTTEQSSQPPARGTPRLRGRGLLIAIAVLLGTGLLVDRCTEHRGRPSAFGDAQRIWIDRDADLEAGEPATFWALKDFELSAEQLRHGEQGAQLLVLADPAALVYLNGILIHAAQYTTGTAVVPVKVGPLLAPRNRLVVEARSGIGAGGLLAALWLRPAPAESANKAGQSQSPVAAGLEQAPIWVTDSSWRVTEQFNRDVLSGLLPLSAIGDLSPPKVRSQLDLGRWRPVQVSETVVDLNLPSHRLTRDTPTRRSQWDALPFEEGLTQPWPSGVVLEFERGTEGCLALSGVDLFRRRVYFLDSAEQLQTLRGPKDLAEQRGEVWSLRSEQVVPISGAPNWIDTGARRFEAVLLEGVAGIRSGDDETAWVQPCAGGSSEPERRLLAGTADS